MTTYSQTRSLTKRPHVKPQLFQAIAQELSSQSRLPFFKVPIISDRQLNQLFTQFCQAAIADSQLARESLLLKWLRLCMQRYSDLNNSNESIGKERRGVKLAREYLEVNLCKIEHHERKIFKPNYCFYCQY